MQRISKKRVKSIQKFEKNSKSCKKYSKNWPNLIKTECSCILFFMTKKTGAFYATVSCELCIWSVDPYDPGCNWTVQMGL
jgi:hypothetical protein